MVITTHDYDEYLEDAIVSVLSQRCQPSNIIVVDDAHTTDTARQIAAKYQLTYTRINANHPLAAREHGCNLATSEFICFLDADDRLSTYYLQQAAITIEKENADLVYSDLEYFGDKNGTTAFPTNIPAKRIAQINFLHVGCVVRRRLLYSSNAFDHPHNNSYQEDWALWRSVLKTKCHYVKQSQHYQARTHTRNRSSLLIAATDYYGLRGIAHADIAYLGIKPNSKLNTINYAARTIDTDYIFFYSVLNQPPPGTCDRLLHHLNSDVAIVHDRNYPDFECTVVVTPVFRDYHYQTIRFDTLQYTNNEKVIIA